MALGGRKGDHCGRLTSLLLITLCVLRLDTSDAAIVILGPLDPQVEAGLSYADRAICGNNLGRSFCAFEDGFTNGATIRVSGLPMDCNVPQTEGQSGTFTGACNIVANTAQCTSQTTSSTFCRSNVLLVDGKPFPALTPDALTYNVGIYTIEFTSTRGPTTCVNSARQPIPCRRVLTVKDENPPVITLVGPSEVILEGGDPFVDQGATGLDIVDGNMQFTMEVCAQEIVNGERQFIGNAGEICRFVVGGDGSTLELDNTKIQDQKIFYVAKDSSGNLGVVTRDVIVQDTQKPVITRIGEQTFTHEAGTKYSDQGATAEDIVDGDITVNILRTDAVNTFPSSTPAQFLVKYNVEDEATNDADEVQRLVIVQDSIPPNLTRLGDDAIDVEGGTLYTEPFATAFDSFEGDITDKIQIVVEKRSSIPCTKSRGCDTDRVDVFAPPFTTFRVTYTVEDSSGNAADEVTRTVRIVDNNKPVLKLIGEALVRLEGATQYVEQGATATDTLDDDDTLVIDIDGNAVDEFAPAFSVFNVSYNTEDEAGNAADTLLRQVLIVDTTKPVITLNGPASLDHLAGTRFQDPNVTATDTLDGGYDFEPRFSSRVRKNVIPVVVECIDGEFESRAPSSEFIRQCSPITECVVNVQFQEAPPTSTSDRTCIDVSPPCFHGQQYEVGAPTGTSDRQCVECPQQSIVSIPSAQLDTTNRCSEINAPQAAHNIAWAESTGAAANLTIQVGDSIIWTHQPDFPVVSGVLVPRGRTQFIEQPDDIFSSNDGARVTIFTFSDIGQFNYFSSSETPSAIGRITVVEKPVFDWCNVNASGTLDPENESVKGLVALAERIRLQEFADLRIDLTAIPEDSNGLCNQIDVFELHRILNTHVVEESGVPIGDELAFVDSDEANGKFEISTDGGDSFVALDVSSPFRVSVTQAGAVHLRFLPSRNFHGETQVQFRRVVSGSQLGDVLATAKLEVLDVNDSPLVTGAADIDMDEDPENVLNCGFNISAVVEGFSDEDGEDFGIAVTEVDDRSGQWEYTCGVCDANVNRVRPERFPGFIPFGSVSDSNATLLEANCRVRFVPVKHFNTEFNELAVARAESERPFFKFRAWDLTQGDNMDTGVDTSVASGIDGSAFSANVITAPLTIFFIEEDPIVHITGVEDEDFDVTFVENGPSVPVTAQDLFIEYPDQPILTSATVQLSNPPFDLDDGEEILIDTTGTFLEIETRRSDKVLTLVLRPIEGNSLDTRFFEKALRTARYSNTEIQPQGQTQGVSMFLEPDFSGPSQGFIFGEAEIPFRPGSNRFDPKSMIVGPGYLVQLFAGVFQGQQQEFQEGSHEIPFTVRSMRVTIVSLNERVVNLFAANGRFASTSSKAIIAMQEVPDAPEADLGRTVSDTSRFVEYEFDSGPLVLCPEATVQDLDSLTLRSMTIRRPNLQPQEFFAVSLPQESLLKMEREQDGSIVLTSNQQSDVALSEYQAALTSLEYEYPRASLSTVSTAPPPPLPTRRIFVTVSDGNIQSTSELILFSDIDSLVPYLDLNGNLPGLDGEPLTFIESQEEELRIIPRIFLLDADGDMLQSASIAITNAADCNQEILDINSATARRFGLTVDYDLATHIMTVTGEAEAVDYRDLFRTLAYHNFANEPTPGERVITVVVNDGQPSPVQRVVITVERKNDKPEINADSGRDVVFVNQDITDDLNGGISLAELVAAAPSPVRPRGRFDARECTDDNGNTVGCNFKSAAETCSAANQQLCSEQQLKDIWPNGNGALRQALWTSEVLSRTNKPTLEELSQSLHGVEIRDASALDNQFGRVLYSYRDAPAPFFFDALQSDTRTGRLHGAACCALDQPGRTAIARFDINGVAGTVTFSQASPTHPTAVRVMLQELRGLATDISIHTIPVSSTTRDAFCTELGSVFNPKSVNDNSCDPRDQATCSVGNLSPRVPLTGLSRANINVLDTNLPLFGKNSIIGRSLLIEQGNTKLACATIEHSALERFQAAISGDIRGSIGLATLADDAAALLTVGLSFSNGQSANGVEWAVVESCQNLGSELSFLGDSSNSTSCGVTDQASCAFGDLSGKLGTLSLPGRAEGQAFADLNLDLPSVVGKAIALRSPLGETGCGVISPLRPKKAVVVLDRGNVIGSVTLEQAAAGSPTQVRVDIRSLEGDTAILGAAFAIFSSPLSADDGTNVCDNLGSLYNPSGVNGPCTRTSPHSDCAVGDLSSRHTSLVQGRLSVDDNNLPLFGTDSVIGRSFVLSKDGQALACGTIHPPGDNIVAIARFQFPITGSVMFVQQTDDAQADTLIRADLIKTDGSSATVGHSWSIHENPVNCDCHPAGEVFNPTESNPPFGSLVQRGSAINLPTTDPTVLTVPGLALAGEQTIVGRSLLIFDANDSTEPIACANIEILNPKVAIAQIDAAGVSGFIKVTQRFPLDLAQLELNLRGLASNVEQFDIHERPAVIGLDVEGEAEFKCVPAGNIFDPFGPSTTCNVRQFTESSDNCAVGDIGGKHGSLTGQSAVDWTFRDTQLNLFGHTSIVGRGLSLQHDKVGTICANLDLSTDEVHLRARFNDPELSGTVTLSQAATDFVGDTRIEVRLATELTGLAWEIIDGDARCQDGEDIFNPFRFSTSDGGYSVRCGRGTKQVGCAVGDLASKHGAPQSEALLLDAQLPLRGDLSVRGKQLHMTDGTNHFCAPLEIALTVAMHDNDGGAVPGVAFTAFSQPHGDWQLKQGDADWEPVAVDRISAENALLLPASEDVRLRFRPDAGYQGQVTCDRCPFPREQSCVPCALDPFLGDLRFRAWDMTDKLEAGSFIHLVGSDSVSTSEKRVSAHVVPTLVNETSPTGTEYDTHFDVRDNVGNNADRITRRVTIVDTERPQLVLRGESSLTHEGGSEYLDAGATALDNRDVARNEEIQVLSIVAQFPSPPTLPLQEEFLVCSGSSFEPENELECLDLRGATIGCVVKPEDGNLTLEGFDFDVDADCGLQNDRLVCYSRQLFSSPPSSFATERTALACKVSPQVTECLHFSEYLGGRYRGPDKEKVDVTAPHGSTFTLNFRVQDRAGNSQVTNRLVTIIDTLAPELSPVDGFKTLEFEPDSVPYAERSDHLSPECPELDSHFTTENITLLGCVRAVDQLDGDLSCGVSISVLVVPETSSLLQDGALIKPTTGDCAEIDGRTNTEECGLTQGGLELVSSGKELDTTFVISYTSRDARGNTAVSVVNVRVVDLLPPSLELAEVDVVVPYASDFTDETALVLCDAVDNTSCVPLVRATDVHDGDLTSQIEVSGFVNTALPGQYEVSYTVTDGRNNTAAPVTRIITVAEQPSGVTGGFALVGGKVNLGNVDSAEFNLVEPHRQFRRAMSQAIRSHIQSYIPATIDLSYINADSIARVEAIGVNTTSRRRATTGTEVTFAANFMCADAGSVVRVLNNLTQDGHTLAALIAQNPDLFAPASAAASGTAGINNAGCPSASKGIDTTVVAGVMIPLIALIFLGLLLLFVWYRKQHERSGGMTITEAIEKAENPTVYWGPYEIPMDTDLEVPMEVAGPDTMKKLKIGAEVDTEEIYSFNNAALIKNVEKPPPAVPKKEREAPPLPTEDMPAFGFSEDGVYEVGDGKSGFSTDDKPVDESRGYLDIQPPPPPPKEQPALPFQYTDDDFYDSGPAVRHGFATHDSGTRSDELDAMQQEVYEVTGQLDKVKPPPPAKRAETPPPPPPPKEEAATTNLPFQYTEDDFYDSGPAVRQGFATHDSTQRSDELDAMQQEVYEVTGQFDKVKPPTPLKQADLPPPPPPKEESTTALPFQYTDEDFYDSGPAVRSGFATHDTGSRSEELDAMQQEVYEVTGQFEKVKPPAPLRKSDTPPPEDDDLPPPPLPMKEADEELPPPPPPKESEEELPPPPPPKEAEVEPATSLPFQYTDEDFYDSGPAVRSGFSTHDQTDRSDTLDAMQQEVYEVTGQFDKVATLRPPPTAAKPAPAPSVVAPAETAAVFIESEDGIYDSGTVVRSGFAAHDRSARSETLQTIQDEVYEVTGSPSKTATMPPPRPQSAQPPRPAKASTLPTSSALTPQLQETYTAMEVEPEDYVDVDRDIGPGSDDIYEAVIDDGRSPARPSRVQPPARPAKQPATLETYDELATEETYEAIDGDVPPARPSKQSRPAPQLEDYDELQADETYEALDADDTYEVADDLTPRRPPKRANSTASTSSGSAPWAHGQINRKEAESRLAAMKEGSFLIRDKATPENYVLSCVICGLFEHHVLVRIDGQFYMNEKPLRQQCHSLAAVIRYLQRNIDQIAIKLTTPVPAP